LGRNRTILAEEADALGRCRKVSADHWATMGGEKMSGTVNGQKRFLTSFLPPWQSPKDRTKADALRVRVLEALAALR